MIESVMRDVRFIRAFGLRDIHKNVVKRYGLAKGRLGIPDSVFEEPMTLLPLSEVNHWFHQLEEITGNPDVVLESVLHFDYRNYGPITRWMFSAVDLSAALRRVNYSLSSLQSGAYLSGSQSGNIIKWVYHNPFIEPHCKVHDSVRMAVMMTKIIRYYVGEDFQPMRVMLSGSRAKDKKYRAYFGCDIGWSHSKTEIWFRDELRLATFSMRDNPKVPLAMSFSDLDDFLNMPEPGDEVKVIYEVINYSCHYGLPTVERVSSLLGMSPQQFQRRLHDIGMNFTAVSGYVMSNKAVELMTKQVPIEEIARRLGYKNIASFNRMFRKQRALTPKQFLQRLNEIS